MKKTIIILILISSSLFSQTENKTQSIELPDFVITGKESINIPKIQKQQPDFISILSREFLTPEFPNEEKINVELPSVESEIVSIGKYNQKFNALLKLSAGLETWPLGEFFFSDWVKQFSYNLHLFGKNELEYVKKGGLSLAGLDFGMKYYVDHSSNLLPGLEIDFNGKYFFESYNFYGSLNPDLERSTNTGYAELSFNYFSDPNNNFHLKFSDAYYNQKDDDIDENIFGLDASYKLKYENFDIKVEGNYKNQSTASTNLSFGNNYYYSTKATLGFKLNGLINLRAGINLSESEGNTFFSPIALASIKLNDKISLFGEFLPNTEFRTLQDFRNANRYYQYSGFEKLFIENKFNIKIATRYAYEKYFEISAGIGYLNSDNNFYYEDNLTEGFFTIHKQDIENSYLFFNFLFRKGPFGEFYADLKLQNRTSQNDNYVPYSSRVLSSANYSFDWNVGFGLKLGLIYYGSAYQDYENINKIPEALDANASFYYQLYRNFKITLEFENLLNDKYYYFRNYRAKTFDVLAGFEFRW